MNAVLVVPAAGSGRRLGLSVPKALADVCGQPMLQRTLEPFAAMDAVCEIVVAVPADSAAAFDAALGGLGRPGCRPRTVAGGSSRQESVRLALASVRRPPPLAVVHDAARPLVTREMVEAVLAEAAAHGAATVVSRPADSVRETVDDGRGGSRTLDRARLRLVGTPQAFRFDLLVQAHERARSEGIEATDDASLVELCTATPVALVERHEINVKVTGPEDLELIRSFVAGRRQPGSRR